MRRVNAAPAALAAGALLMLSCSGPPSKREVGALGGAALGIGAGLAWTQIFRTTAGFEGYNGILVSFTFMPLGAAIGGLGGAFLFGVIAIRDAEIALEQKPAHRRDR